MKELIKKIQKQWKTAKDAAQSLCKESGQYDMANKLGECEMFKGTETLEELVKLMFTPKGIEFLTTYNFPDLATFRKFKKYHPERYGLFIDCGEVELSEVRKVFLVGKTSAKLRYNDTAANRVYLMHGASATITASGYSVVKIEKDDTCNISVIKLENAVVR